MFIFICGFSDWNLELILFHDILSSMVAVNQGLYTSHVVHRGLALILQTIYADLIDRVSNSHATYGAGW